MRRAPSPRLAAALSRALAPALASVLALAACAGPADGPEDAGGASETPSLAGAAEGWNVLLLSIDTLRADRLGAWGHDRPTSPVLDELVAGGVRLERATAPRAATWPSLASVLSGLYPTAHGVVQNGYEFPDDVLTLPKLLEAAGYQTGAFLGNMCRANHRGWDELFCGKGVDPDVNRAALEWMEGRDPERPFLLWVHYFGAHSPYYNGGAFAERFVDPGYRGPVAAKKGVLTGIMEEQLPLAPEDVEHLDALYDAAVLGTDRNTGILLDGLAASGALERTVVVLLADHGEDLYDHHGYLYHACSVYESSLHVPLAFVAPGLLPEGAGLPGPAELIDVLPTLLDLLGIGGISGFHGRSLLSELATPDAPPRPPPTISEYGTTEIRTVLDDGWKLVSNPNGHTPLCFPTAPADLYPIERLELYDLASDPGEERNVAAEHPERVAALNDLIRRRFEGLPDRARPQEVPEELKRELEALGYLVE